jgi:hypothetical protein
LPQRPLGLRESAALYGIYIAAPQSEPRFYMRNYRSIRGPRSYPMLDATFVAGGFGLFFVAVLYVFACDRL